MSKSGTKEHREQLVRVAKIIRKVTGVDERKAIQIAQKAIVR